MRNSVHASSVFWTGQCPHLIISLAFKLYEDIVIFQSLNFLVRILPQLLFSDSCQFTETVMSTDNDFIKKLSYCFCCCSWQCSILYSLCKIISDNNDTVLFSQFKKFNHINASVFSKMCRNSSWCFSSHWLHSSYLFTVSLTCVQESSHQYLWFNLCTVASWSLCPDFWYSACRVFFYSSRPSTTHQSDTFLTEHQNKRFPWAKCTELVFTIYKRQI